MTQSADPGPVTAASSRVGSDAPDPAIVAAARVWARLSRVLELTLQDSPLTLPQFRVLLFVAREPRRAGDLARRSDLSNPALTMLVNGLVEGGQMSRQPVQGDRRGVALALTTEGLTCLRATELLVAARLCQLVNESRALHMVDDLLAVGARLDEEFEARSRLVD